MTEQKKSNPILVYGGLAFSIACFGGYFFLESKGKSKDYTKPNRGNYSNATPTFETPQPKTEFEKVVSQSSAGVSAYEEPIISKDIAREIGEISSDVLPPRETAVVKNTTQVKQSEAMTPQKANTTEQLQKNKKKIVQRRKTYPSREEMLYEKTLDLEKATLNASIAEIEKKTANDKNEIAQKEWETKNMDAIKRAEFLTKHKISLKKALDKNSTLDDSTPRTTVTTQSSDTQLQAKEKLDEISAPNLEIAAVVINGQEKTVAIKKGSTWMKLSEKQYVDGYLCKEIVSNGAFFEKKGKSFFIGKNN